MDCGPRDALSGSIPHHKGSQPWVSGPFGFRCGSPGIRAESMRHRLVLQQRVQASGGCPSLMRPLPEFIMQCSRVLGAVALLGTLSTSLFAQGWIDPVRPVPPPQDLNGRVERLRSAVQVSISGRVARVTVEEWFRNNRPALEEGMYHFPLPGEAVFSSYSLWQGDQELRGEAMDATQARSI